MLPPSASCKPLPLSLTANIPYTHYIKSSILILQKMLNIFLTAKKTVFHCFSVKCDHYQGVTQFLTISKRYCRGSSLTKPPKRLDNKNACPLVKMGILIPVVPPVSSTVALVGYILQPLYYFVNTLFALFSFFFRPVMLLTALTILLRFLWQLFLYV